MWWCSSGYGPAPWMFVGPMMLLFLAICFAGVFFMMRATHRYRSEAAGVGRVGVWGVGVWPSGHDSARGTETPDNRHSAFEEYRAQTLQRLDQEQQEFQEFIARLRAAKDKAEFEQFVADRQMRRPGPQA
jgi:Protein of unknown function (DUF2852)